VAHLSLPPGFGTPLRQVELRARCRSSPEEDAIRLKRFPLPQRGSGRAVWLYGKALDAALVQALVLNLPRDTAGDVALMVHDVALEEAAPGQSPLPFQWVLNDACKPVEDEGGRLFQMLDGSEHEDGCVLEALSEGGKVHALCAIWRDQLVGAMSEQQGLEEGELLSVPHDPSASAPLWPHQTDRNLHWSKHKHWSHVRAEDVHRAIHDPSSHEHDAVPDARASALARVAAGEVAHHHCVGKEGSHPESGAVFLEPHKGARLESLAAPLIGPNPQHLASIWGRDAPLCASDATIGGSDGESEHSWDETLEFSMLQERASSQVGALAHVRESLEAGFPGLDKMLGPIMDGILAPVTEVIGGVVGDTIGSALMNLLGQSTDSGLTAEVTKILTANLVGALTSQLVPPTGESVASAVTAATAAHIRQMIPPSIGERLADDITAKLVPRLAPALAERISERVADGVAAPLSATLQHMLTRSVSAAAVPALAHALTHSPAADYYCFLCDKSKNSKVELYCSYCKQSKAPSTLAHAHYYAAYYGAYYAEWGAQPRAPRAGESAKHAEERAEELADIVRKSQLDSMKQE
jgi:hypothetical protein